MKAFLKNFALFIAIFLILALLFSLSSADKGKTEAVGLQTVVAQINAGQVAAIEVQKNNLKIKLTNGNQEEARKEPSESLSALLKNFNVDNGKLSAVDIRIKDESGSDMWMNVILPLVLPILLIGAFIYFMMRSVQGANNKAMMFGQTSAKDATKDGKVKTKFADVAGAKEAKEELTEVVEFLREPKKFTDLGAKIPRGVLLLGKPGVGKTLLARAVAGEANAPFFSISGSEFVEMFVGVGASRVRDLFKKAKKNAPCIVFIDEIDAVGRRRGSGMGGSHDEREQTLNQILVEMDGFETNLGIIVIAATNRPDVLDPALMRPGRFDRQVMIDMPDIADREAILSIHAKDKPLANNSSLRRIAERTPGFSGADLANVLNEGAILAARDNRKEILMTDLYNAIEKVMLGPEKKSRIITEQEKKITAYHEAGHAIVTNFLPHTDPVHKVSIIARGQAGGYTLKMPTEDRHMHTKEEFIEEIAVLMGGYLAEQEIFGQVTTGATSDLRQATQVARLLVTDFGMSETMGPRTYGDKEEMIFLGREIHEQRDYSEKTAEKIDAEITAFIEQGILKAKQILQDQKTALEKVAQVLLEKETIERDEFDALLKV